MNRILAAETHGFSAGVRGHGNQQRSASELNDSIDLYGHTPLSPYLATTQFFKIYIYIKTPTYSLLFYSSEKRQKELPSPFLITDRSYPRNFWDLANLRRQEVRQSEERSDFPRTKGKTDNSRDN